MKLWQTLKEKVKKPKVYVEVPPIELIYGWRGAYRVGVRPYLRIYRVNVAGRSEAMQIAVRRAARGRLFVQHHLLCQNPPSSLDAWYQELSDICDEIFPSPKSYPERLPTHLIECGVQSPGKPQSAFFKASVCLLGQRHNFDYAAIAIGAFLAWEIGRWPDFVGAALSEQQLWMMRCLIAKWKSLR